MTYGSPLLPSADGSSIRWKCRCEALLLPVLPSLASLAYFNRILSVNLTGSG
jgi:hypothetical protein